MDDQRGLCPAGWNVPSDDDWTTLVDYVVSQGYLNEWNNPNGASNALKSCRQVGHPSGGDCNTSVHPRWNSHDIHAGLDEFGFSLLPGGFRASYGIFLSVGVIGCWWSATELSDTEAWSMLIRNLSGSVEQNDYFKSNGLSVRCMRDIVRTEDE